MNELQGQRAELDGKLNDQLNTITNQVKDQGQVSDEANVLKAQFESQIAELDNQIKELGLNAHFVANVHDEWQIEVKEDQADQVGQLGVQAIRDTQQVLNLNCPLDGEYQIGDNWSETH